MLFRTEEIDTHIDTIAMSDSWANDSFEQILTKNLLNRFTSHTNDSSIINTFLFNFIMNASYFFNLVICK